MSAPPPAPRPQSSLSPHTSSQFRQSIRRRPPPPAAYRSLAPAPQTPSPPTLAPASFLPDRTDAPSLRPILRARFRSPPAHPRTALRQSPAPLHSPESDPP